MRSKQLLPVAEKYPKIRKWLVPQTKHYSWMKALDICGVGLDQMVAIPVQEDYRMDINALEKQFVN